MLFVLVSLLGLSAFLLYLTRSLSDWHNRRSTTWKRLGLPEPDPLWNYELETAETRDVSYIYCNKTLRHPYHQTMAHQPMHPNDWIEIDHNYIDNLERKKTVIRDHGRDVLDSLPENDSACTELLELLSDYLPKRYPTLFEPLRGGILNKVTGEKFYTISRRKGVDALQVISRLVQDDFLMARERSDGEIYCVGGLVAFPGSYLLSKKINRSITSIHVPAVPQFKETILKSVNRVLKRFQPCEPFERTSWSIVDDTDLFWHNIPCLTNWEADNIFTIPEHAKLSVDPRSSLWLRMDHQTFLKLPRTGSIIFGIHPVLRPLRELAESPLVPKLLSIIHTDSRQELLEYKLTPRYNHLITSYLQELTDKQIELGVIQLRGIHFYPGGMNDRAVFLSGVMKMLRRFGQFRRMDKSPAAWRRRRLDAK